MNCSNCQTPIQPGAAFCDNCGTPVSATPPMPSAAPMAGGDTICPQCQTAAMPGEAFCGNCGASLSQVGAAPAYQPPVAPAVAPVTPVYQPPAVPQSAISCSQCGTSLAAGSAFCDNCGAAVEASPPAQSWQVPQPPQPQQWQPAVAMTPRLVVQETSTPLNLPSGKNELLIGREDQVSGHFPEVDLGPYKGEELGVSRSHAKLAIQGNQCFLEDLQSVNFTHVNKQRLHPGTRQPLNNGDELRFGKLVVMFYTQ